MFSCKNINSKKILLLEQKQEGIHGTLALSFTCFKSSRDGYVAFAFSSQLRHSILKLKIYGPFYKVTTKSEEESEKEKWETPIKS